MRKRKRTKRKVKAGRLRVGEEGTAGQITGKEQEEAGG